MCPKTLEEQDFLSAQKAFSAYLRDPQNQPKPEGLNERRVAVYENAVFVNIAQFLSDNFPRVKEFFDSQSWDELVRDYIVRHRSDTACFVDLPQEFLSYIENLRDEDTDPPFLYELAHFEWLETLLSTDERKLPEVSSRSEDVLGGIPIINPIATLVKYNYPVHRLSPENYASDIASDPTFIVAYRRPNHQFGFVDVNMATARLVELLGANETSNGRQLLEALAAEMGAQDVEAIVTGGADILKQLVQDEVILGVR